MKCYHDRAWLEEKYWGEGLSQSEIAKVAGCRQQIIARWMKRLDVPRRDLSTAHKMSWIPERHKAFSEGLRNAWENGAYDGRSTEEWLRKNSESTKAQWQRGDLGSAKWRALRSEYLKEAWKTGSYASEEYRAKFSGENNPNWKGGISSERDRFTNSPEWKEWHQAVFERDYYQCQVCGDGTSDNLIVHHLNSFDKHPSQRTELSNGVTLCKGCHVRFHNTYGYGSNTYSQFTFFIGV